MKVNLNCTLILGSKSPRRQELLKKAGFDFRVESIDCDEAYPETIPAEEVAKYLAEKKSRAYKKELKDDEVLLTADTIVLIGQKILGKPDNEKEAMEMLKELSGHSHAVITGVCIRARKHLVSFQDTTLVTFRNLSDEEIIQYIKEENPMDKAGAYGIQDWIGVIGVDSIQGSYFNVVGLPIHRVYSELVNFNR